FGSDRSDGDGLGRSTVRIGAFSGFLAGMADATVVLLRIENDGAEPITSGDYTSPDPMHGLTVVFSGRTVQGVAVTQLDAGDEYLMEHFTPEGQTGLRYSGNSILLPRVPLNLNKHFKLLVLLTGGPVNSGVWITGGIQG